MAVNAQDKTSAKTVAAKEIAQQIQAVLLREVRGPVDAVALYGHMVNVAISMYLSVRYELETSQRGDLLDEWRQRTRIHAQNLLMIIDSRSPMVTAEALGYEVMRLERPHGSEHGVD